MYNITIEGSVGTKTQKVFSSDENAILILAGQLKDEYAKDGVVFKIHIQDPSGFYLT